MKRLAHKTLLTALFIAAGVGLAYQVAAAQDEKPKAVDSILARATAKNKTCVVWDVKTEGGNYKLVAKGPEGKARVITLALLDAQPD